MQPSGIGVPSGARLMRWLVWLSIRQMVARQRERSLGLTSRSCSGLKRKPRTFSGAGTADLICSRWAPTATLLLAPAAARDAAIGASMVLKGNQRTSSTQHIDLHQSPMADVIGLHGTLS